ncbi:AraC family transcriptional regulator [Paenibacillus elgii]|uniref:AraC family transcriptional regulator n=1 Tax=Paenibacillus elgii TaxID=189691 RepID=A0A2T6G7H1_9BACL|nr:AraC family transcriptional regulator [Paenibacillus elgii]NEN83514.1 helix-turn-helix transcriptional regulator [Paenibacillus elgii]PUA40108.1 AraC family transcriptional regulator [Paenibacillus elgii]
MDHLHLRSNLTGPLDPDIPFTVYTVGTEEQQLLTRLEGFSANQLFLTFSGTGCFRLLGEDNRSLITPGTLLYIPAGLPYECGPQGAEPWSVGYLTFVDRQEGRSGSDHGDGGCGGSKGLLANWGFGSTFFRAPLRNWSRLYDLLQRIWGHSGPNYDPWVTAELLFSFCLEIKKQLAADNERANAAVTGADRYPHSVVYRATRFLQDHLQRNLTVTELAAHVGYSPKQLTRLFRESLGTTPLQYMQRIRLQTAASLLEQQPSMAIRQAAAHVGMEPVYFTRLFRRLFGVTPSDFADGKKG